MLLSETKLYYYLSAFHKGSSPDEIKRFHDYLSSPLSGSDPSLITFHAGFVRHVVMGKVKDGNDLYTKAFPGKAYSVNHLRERMSTLLKVFHDFIAFCEYEKDGFARKKYQAQALLNRGMTQYLRPALDKALKDLSKQNLLDEDNYYMQLTLEHQLAGYLTATLPRSGKLVFQSLDHNLDTWYAIRKLRYACLIFNYHKEHGTRADINAIEPFISYLKPVLQEMPLLVRCYYFAYLCAATADNHEAFFQLNTLFRGNILLFSTTVTMELFISLANYSLHQANMGEPGFEMEAASLFDFFNAEITPLHHRSLPPSYIKNQITLLARSSAWVKAYSALDVLKNTSIGKNDNPAVLFSTAIIRFYEGNYTASDRLFNTLLEQNDDLFFALGARTYLWKTDFLRKDFTSFFSRYHMLRAFLTSQKHLSHQHKTNYLNFIRYFKKLGDLLYHHSLGKKGRDQKLIALLGTITQTRNVIHKGWLLKEISSCNVIID